MSSKSEDENNITPPRLKPKKQCRRVQKFRQAWLKENNFKTWLESVPDNPEKAKCKVCNTLMKAEKSVLDNHIKSQSHQSKHVSFQPKITSFSKIVGDDPGSNKDTSKFEIKLCGLLAEHNISFRLLDHLTPLLKDCIPDSKIVQNMHLKITKGAAIIKNVIGASEKEVLKAKLNSSKFSVLIDESTDIACVKTMCVVIRFFDEDERRVVSKFWDLCQVFEKNSDAEAATAKHLYDLLHASIENGGVSFGNVIGFGSDGCNTMMGSYNSVKSRFLESLPGITVFQCICHSLHLCSSEACKVLPRSCEDLARNIYNEFKNSSKRQHNFQKFQEFLELEIHKILRPAQTRWLSLGAVVNRILEQWEALKLYFQAQLTTARVHAVEQIVQALNNSLIKLFYTFLDWVLPKFNKLNEFFQSDSVIMTTVYDKMAVGYQELLEAYMQRSYINSTELSMIDPSDVNKRVLPEQMYFGATVLQFLEKPDIRNNRALINDFKQICAEFLSVSCTEIRKRFDFNNQLLKDLRHLDPTNAMLNKTRNVMPSLLPIMLRVPRIVTEKQYQIIDDEWRTLPYFELPGDMDVKKDKVDIFWAKLESCDEGDQGLTFRNLSKFVLNLISLPHSNAECERIFSKVNLIKTKSRNKMLTPTLNGLLLAKQRVGNCLEYTPTKLEYSRMTKNALYPDHHPQKAVGNSRKTISNLYENEICLIDEINMEDE